jgi:hypothetical protein
MALETDGSEGMCMILKAWTSHRILDFGGERVVVPSPKEAGYQVLNSHLDTQGLRVWVSQP